MYTLRYVDNEMEQYFICQSKMEALNKVKTFFQDRRKNKPIAYQLLLNDTVIIDSVGFEELEECYMFFQHNPSYGKGFYGSDNYYDLEFK